VTVSQVIMPKMGDGMEEGTLLRWLKQVGDQVDAGDPIAEIETDKVALEIEAADKLPFETYRQLYLAPVRLSE